MAEVVLLLSLASRVVDPPAGRRTGAGVVARAPPGVSMWRPKVQIKTKSKSHETCFSPTLWFLRRAQDPIPSRTRPSNPSAPMVLSLKTWESRSLQGLPKTRLLSTPNPKPPGQKCPGGFAFEALPKPKPHADRSTGPGTTSSPHRKWRQGPVETPRSGGGARPRRAGTAAGSRNGKGQGP